MKKIKILILAGVALVGMFFVVGRIQNSYRVPDEYTLIYEGDNKKDIWIDIAIQNKDGLLYLGSILLKDSEPTMQDVVETLNNSDVGVLIAVDNNGIIVSVNEYSKSDMYNWNVYINNKRTTQNNISEINVKDYDGITLMFE